MIWYGMVWYILIYIAQLLQKSNALCTLLPRKQPSFQALFEGAKVLLCVEVVRQSSKPLGRARVIPVFLIKPVTVVDVILG